MHLKAKIIEREKDVELRIYHADQLMLASPYFTRKVAEDKIEALRKNHTVEELKDDSSSRPA